MSRHNDTCERCGNEPYYDGHEAWCVWISELVERIEFLEAHVHGVNFIDKTTPPQSGGSR